MREREIQRFCAVSEDDDGRGDAPKSGKSRDEAGALFLLGEHRLSLPSVVYPRSSPELNRPRVPRVLPLRETNRTPPAAAAVTEPIAEMV